MVNWSIKGEISISIPFAIQDEMTNPLMSNITGNGKRGNQIKMIGANPEVIP